MVWVVSWLLKTVETGGFGLVEGISYIVLLRAAGGLELFHPDASILMQLLGVYSAESR